MVDIETQEAREVRFILTAGKYRADIPRRDAAEPPKPAEEELEFPPLPSEQQSPRSLAQILEQRQGGTLQMNKAATAVGSGGLVLKPWMLFAGPIAIGAAVLFVVFSLINSRPPQTVPTPAVVISTNTAGTTVVQTPTANPADASIPLSQRYGSTVVAVSEPPRQTASGTTDGVSFVANPDGTLQIEIPKDTACPPAWSSPPPDWPTDKAQAMFASERSGCILRDTKLAITGWYGDTNWVFIIRPKTAGGSTKDPSAVDLVWSDITWFGHTMEEVRALPEAKNGTITDRKPKPTAVIPTFVPQPVYQPAPPAVVQEQPQPSPVVFTTAEPTPVLPTIVPTRAESEHGTGNAPAKPTRQPTSAPTADEAVLATAAAVLNNGATPTQGPIQCALCHH